jgi:lipopolysaccharide export system protein LptA
MKIVKIVCFIILFPTSAWAQNEPLDIQADMMEGYQNEKLIIFKGNVRAKQKDIELYADKVKVFLIENKNTSQQQDLREAVERIEAEGHVIITQGERKASGKRAIFYQVPQRRLVLIGNARIEEKENLILGEEATFFLKENKIVIKGAPAQATIFPKNFKK